MYWISSRFLGCWKLGISIYSTTALHGRTSPPLPYGCLCGWGDVLSLLCHSCCWPGSQILDMVIPGSAPFSLLNLFALLSFSVCCQTVMTESMLSLCLTSGQLAQFLIYTRNKVKMVWILLIVLLHWHILVNVQWALDTYTFLIYRFN